MLYALTGTIRPHLTLEQRNAGFARRAEWKYPAGLKVIGEWWQGVAPHILMIAEADSMEPLLAVTLTWGDFMEITWSPAQTPEEGLASGAKLLRGG